MRTRIVRIEEGGSKSRPAAALEEIDASATTNLERVSIEFHSQLRPSYNRDEAKASPGPQVFLSPLERRLFGWRFGLTSQGHYSLVPSHSKEGDVICVPIGSSTPFVLRPVLKEDGLSSEHCELIGRCYVHDFMDGQAMASLLDALENEGVEARSGLSVASERIHAELKSFILV